MKESVYVSNQHESTMNETPKSLRSLKNAQQDTMNSAVKLMVGISFIMNGDLFNVSCLLGKNNS